MQAEGNSGKLISGFDVRCLSLWHIFSQYINSLSLFRPLIRKRYLIFTPVAKENCRTAFRPLILPSQKTQPFFLADPIEVVYGANAGVS